MSERVRERPGRRTVPVLAVLAVLIAGCDMGSYNPIARALDPFEPMGDSSRAWMAASGSVGDSEAVMLILQEGLPVSADLGAYALFTAADTAIPSAVTSTKMVRGIYEVSGSTIVFHPGVEYNGSYRQTGSPSNFPPPLDRDGERFSYTWSGGNPTLTLTSGSVNLNLTSLDGSGGVLHDIRSDLVSADPATRDIGASRFLKVYQMGIYASQMMVPGFGGTGMMTYYNKETPFNGLVDGQERVLMSRLLPIARVDFRYDGMINVPGLEMSGLLRTDSNASGSGSMSETVAIAVDDLNNAPYDMTVSYNGIGITGTIPDAGGVYAMTVDTGGGPVDVTVLTDDLIPGNLDFAAVMP